MIPTPDKLALYYPSKDLASHGAALPDRSVMAGSTALTIMTNSITQATGYWNGALGFFCGSTTQQELKGKTFHVWKWIKEENRIYITTPLPVIPGTSDKFRIFAGGKYASSQEVFGLLVGGKQPEADDTVIGTNISGVTIKKASGMLGEGELGIQFNATTKTLAIRMGTGLYGPEVTLTKNETIPVFNSDFSGFILADVVFSALKTTGTHTDTYPLTIPKNVLIPNYEGYETNTGKLVERYHLFALKNTSAAPSDAMTALSLWCVKPDYASVRTTAASSNSLFGQPGSVVMAAGVSTWPTRGFWVYNTTTPAAFYVQYRNGTTLYLAPRSDGCFTFQNGTGELQKDAVLQFNSGVPTTANGTWIVTRIDIASGTLAAGNARGICHFTKATGTSYTLGVGSSSTNCYLTNTSTIVCAATGNYNVYRGWRPLLDLRAANYDALSASSGGNLASIANKSINSNDLLEVWPDFDLGIVASTGLHADPANEYTAPDGIMFQPYVAETKPLLYDLLLGGDALSVWVRQTIVDGTQARQNIVGSIRAMWY
jgi:hypothetical protein